eukprot:ctg_2770.g521
MQAHNTESEFRGGNLSPSGGDPGMAKRGVCDVAMSKAVAAAASQPTAVGRGEEHGPLVAGSMSPGVTSEALSRRDAQRLHEQGRPSVGNVDSVSDPRESVGPASRLAARALVVPMQTPSPAAVVDGSLPIYKSSAHSVDTDGDTDQLRALRERRKLRREQPGVPIRLVDYHRPRHAAVSRYGRARVPAVHGVAGGAAGRSGGAAGGGRAERPMREPPWPAATVHRGRSGSRDRGHAVVAAVRHVRALDVTGPGGRFSGRFDRLGGASRLAGHRRGVRAVVDGVQCGVREPAGERRDRAVGAAGHHRGVLLRVVGGAARPRSVGGTGRTAAASSAGGVQGVPLHAPDADPDEARVHGGVAELGRLFATVRARDRLGGQGGALRHLGAVLQLGVGVGRFGAAAAPDPPRRVARRVDRGQRVVGGGADGHAARPGHRACHAPHRRAGRPLGGHHERAVQPDRYVLQRCGARGGHRGAEHLHRGAVHRGGAAGRAADRLVGRAHLVGAAGWRGDRCGVVSADSAHPVAAGRFRPPGHPAVHAQSGFVSAGGAGVVGNDGR